MQALIYRVLSNPWGYRLTCLVLFTAVMLGLRWLAHAIVDQGGARAIWAVNAVWVPALLLFGVWWDRKGNISGLARQYAPFDS